VPNINFRPTDEDQYERLATAAKANNRPVAVEMRAAIDVYLDLLELAKLREEAVTEAEKLAPEERETVALEIKDSIGRTLLAAVSRQARRVFEQSAGVKYPVGKIGRIIIPFDRLIDWIVSGDAKPSETIAASIGRD
jgi:hypothetical protein